VENGPLDPLDDQLRDPVSTLEADWLVPVRVEQRHLDLAPVARVDGPRCVHDRHPVVRGQAGPGVHERRVPRGQRDGQPGPHQRTLAGGQLNVLGRRQVRARIPGMGIRRQRDAGIKTFDQHVGFGMRQRGLLAQDGLEQMN
jgi:hypothetical protein